jgi:hypothetical protein
VDHLIALGHLDTAPRAPVEALAALHIDAQGGDVEKSLVAVPDGRSTRDSAENVLSARAGLQCTIHRRIAPHRTQSAP